MRQHEDIEVARYLVSPPDPPRSVCPHCGSEVDNEVTQCPECGGYFPAWRHREGAPMLGAMCGAVRGIALVTFMTAFFAFLWLLVPPFAWSKLAVLLISLVMFVVFFRLAGFLHQRAYRVRL